MQNGHLTSQPVCVLLRHKQTVHPHHEVAVGCEWDISSCDDPGTGNLSPLWFLGTSCWSWWCKIINPLADSRHGMLLLYVLKHIQTKTSVISKHSPWLLQCFLLPYLWQWRVKSTCLLMSCEYAARTCSQACVHFYNPIFSTVAQTWRLFCSLAWQVCCHGIRTGRMIYIITYANKPKSGSFHSALILRRLYPWAWEQRDLKAWFSSLDLLQNREHPRRCTVATRHVQPNGYKWLIVQKHLITHAMQMHP